ncbi:MAG: hypothetical protein M5T61_19010 [Acidimicrobiia bacterium]|nr:hypothetical protein [Acidimicrobiia bacterium]
MAHAYLRLAGVLDLGQLPKADLLREFRLLHLALCRSDDDDGDDGPTLIEIIEADRAAAKAKP